MARIRLTVDSFFFFLMVEATHRFHVVRTEFLCQPPCPHRDSFSSLFFEGGGWCLTESELALSSSPLLFLGPLHGPVKGETEKRKAHALASEREREKAGTLWYS